MIACLQNRWHFTKLALGGLVLLALAACSQEKKAEAAPSDPYVAAGKLAELPTDHVLGDADAPVQIVEYASLQCHHCRDFEVGSADHAAVFPQLEEKYIKTGKVRFIFRDYPLDAFATAATLAANCVAGTTGDEKPTDAENTRYFATVKLLYSQLDYWYLNAGTADVVMKRLPEVLRSAGMSEAAFQSCLDNESLLARVRAGYDEASSKFGISSTPTFFINGEKHSGVIDFDKLEAILSKLLPGDAPTATPQQVN